MLPWLQARLSRARLEHRVAATAVLVALGYYAGANLGFILRFPPSTPSVVWPPNSILTATLLVAPRRRWWIYLVAAFPAHPAVELSAGLPLPPLPPPSRPNSGEALFPAPAVRPLS